MNFEQLLQVRADLVHYSKHEPKHYWCTENWWENPLLPRSDNSMQIKMVLWDKGDFTIRRTLISKVFLISREQICLLRIKSNREKEDKLFKISLQTWIFLSFSSVYAKMFVLLWRAGGEGDDKGWDGWMASPTRWAWVWVNSGSWWWTGRPGVLQSMGWQRIGHNWVTELNFHYDNPVIGIRISNSYSSFHHSF